MRCGCRQRIVACGRRCGNRRGRYQRRSTTRLAQHDVAQLGEAGGGPLVFDDGHHKFALAWHFMGDPEEVHAFTGDTEGPGGMRFDAQSIISFRFPGNRVGNLEIVYSPDMELVTPHYAQDDRVEITGTAGVLFINGGHGRLGATPPVTLYRTARSRPTTCRVAGSRASCC
ncbi:Gfo/Idh/MocA family protein [Paraburkholderia atlantica]|uniref:Gfo/Idh/MocA family protein n=1 Tax=Paraburkholderia atlantica TaxID=2654982 RepID=UPI0001BF14AC|nr:Gfo/Idh/MocA family oxidoreductase [Paraburkholderia atlantica]